MDYFFGMERSQYVLEEGEGENNYHNRGGIS